MRIMRAPFSERRNRVIAVLLAVTISAVLYRLNRAFGGFLSDPGYLWYGVQRVLAGEVPIRDFMSYEVGRYYLSALLLYPFGTDGLLALRAVLAVVAALSLGVSIGLSGAHARESRPWRLLPMAVLFALWLVPRHKVFDIAISALLVLGVYRLLRAPGVARFFQFGLMVGIAATIGQNHGAYGLVASGFAGIFLLVGTPGAVSPRTFLAWSAGVVVGYLPVLLTALFARGFLHAEINALHYVLFNYRGTNLPLPIPWPWSATAHATSSLRQALISGFFLALPVSLLIAFVAILRRVRRGIQPQEALFVAAWTVALPYANVAFSRADVAHLAQAMLPYLLLALATPAFLGWRRFWQPLLASALVLASVPVVLSMQPRMTLWHGAHPVPATVHDDRVMVSPFTKKLLAVARREHVHGPVLAMPYYPGLMAALGEKSPIWEIYPLFPRKPPFEEREIERLRAAAPFCIIVSGAPLDGRKALTYSVTHPITFRYIRAHYEKQTTLAWHVVVYTAAQ